MWVPGGHSNDGEVHQVHHGSDHHQEEGGAKRSHPFTRPFPLVSERRLVRTISVSVQGVLVLPDEDVVGEPQVELDHPGDDGAEGGEQSHAIPQIKT